MKLQETKVERTAAIIFLIIGVFTVLEYIMIRGMFTAPIMIFLSVVVGICNIIIALAKKKYINALFFVLLTVALNMGYYMIGRY